uniref:Uncharacterized protein n=1 Tax=Rangifer tarandus platyrhynchus TaxID=3082113 RepID=A0ACB0DX44_RANTA|nr:unnamed protein product [Rangifer tarandus platyrhynchus]
MEDEVIRIAKKMDKMVQKKNAAGALDLLKELKNIPMTLELLQSTRIGMSVNAIRKQSTDEEVTSLAKSLIKSWKKLLDGPSTDKDSEEKKKDTAVTSQNSPEAREESSSSGNMSSRKDETNARDTYVSSFPRAPSTSDSVRLKCREMLAAALRTGDDYIAIGADEEELGSQIEEDILCMYIHNVPIYQEIRNTDMKYKNRVRSRISNLKDAKNPNLRKNVLCGHIPPDLFARMTAEEMASDELKEMRKNLTKEAIREHQMAKTGGTQTDLFTCGKCKKKNCTYTQVQTRSADEPMTTFVVCNECGNRWKVGRAAGFLLARSVGWFLPGGLPRPFSGGCAVCPTLTLPQAGVCRGSHRRPARTRTATPHAARRPVLAQEPRGLSLEVQLLCPPRCSRACSSSTPAPVREPLCAFFLEKLFYLVEIQPTGFSLHSRKSR